MEKLCCHAVLPFLWTNEDKCFISDVKFALYHENCPREATDCSAFNCISQPLKKELVYLHLIFLLLYK